MVLCIEIIIKEQQHLRLPVLIGCGQVCVWMSRIPGAFNHQYLWKEIIETFVLILSIFFICLFNMYFVYFCLICILCLFILCIYFLLIIAGIHLVMTYFAFRYKCWKDKVGVGPARNRYGQWIVRYFIRLNY